MIKKTLLAVVIFVFSIAWSNDPDINTPVCTAPDYQFIIGMVSDGAGGAIIAWSDERGGDCDIYMQRLSAAGKALWGHNGRFIFGGSNTQITSDLIPDGSGGVVFAAGDETAPYSNDYEWYAKRVNSSGNVSWTSALIFTSENSAPYFKVISDGAGGVFLFWQKEISDNNRIFGQHVDGAGNILWTAGGIPVSSVEGYQYPPFAAADGRGGAYVAWENYSGSPSYYDIFIQRIDGSGNLLWGQDGIRAYDYGVYSNQIYLLRDKSNGVYLAWPGEDYCIYGYCNNIRMQRFNSAGTRLWAEDGAVVFIYPSWGYYGYIDGMVLDNTGGLYMLVNSYYCDDWGYSDYDLDLQHTDPSGSPTWGSKGVPINSDLGQRYANMTTGAGRKAIVVWEKWDSDNEFLKAQLFNKTGTPQWADDGLTVADANFGKHSYMEIISTDSGGAVVAWHYHGDIYAQSICASGGLGDCVLPIAVIKADRFGGVAPAEIQFDGSGSYDPDGTIKQWSWDLGDGTTASTAKVTHTYNDIGVYKVTLRVKDNSGLWSKPVKVSVKTFSVDALTAAFDFFTGPIKAKKKGQASVRAELYDKPRTAEERPIPIDLGLTFETDKGTWLEEMAFHSTTYVRHLTAETPGTANIKALLEGRVLGTAKITFAYLSPPINVKVNLEAVRSLFRGIYHAHISWSENPAEVFTPAEYRVYRSTDGAAYEMVTEVDAETFSYTEENLPAGNDYTWAVAMVDEAGDESDRAIAAVAASTLK